MLILVRIRAHAVKFRNGLDSSAENLFDTRDVNNFKGFSCFSGLSILLR